MQLWCIIGFTKSMKSTPPSGASTAPHQWPWQVAGLLAPLWQVLFGLSLQPEESAGLVRFIKDYISFKIKHTYLQCSKQILWHLCDGAGSSGSIFLGFLLLSLRYGLLRVKNDLHWWEYISCSIMYTYTIDYLYKMVVIIDYKSQYCWIWWNYGV